MHLVQSSPPEVTLERYRIKIINEIDGVALRIGKLLREAKLACPDGFARWVESDLPFGHETARRLMSISSAYEKLSPDVLRGLPRPWQALYALKELPPVVLEVAVAGGDITPSMTVVQAQNYARKWRGRETNSLFKKADQFAGRLLRLQPSDLSPQVLEALRRWLASETDRHTTASTSPGA